MAKRFDIWKGCTFCVAFLLIDAGLFAQNEQRSPKQQVLTEDLFLLPHLELLISPNVNSKAKLVHFNTAHYELESSPQLSYEFGIHKLTNMSVNLSIIYGFHFGLIGRNSSYIVPAREIGLSRDEEYPFAGPIARERDISFFSFPISIEHRFIKSVLQRKFLFLRAGISLRFAPLNNTSNADMEVMEVRLHGNKKPFINLNSSFGVAYVLNNFDLVRIAFNYNFDPSFVAKGDFELHTNSSDDYGTYTVKGSCVGLHFIYTRTRMKRNVWR